MKDRTYKVITNLNYDGYKSGLASMVYKFFDKKKKLGASVNEKLAQE